MCQKNLKKYMGLRDWGWFIAIQKTRPLIGRPDPNEELRILEEKAASTYGLYKEKLDIKEKLLKENTLIAEEKKALMEQIDKEQGSMSQYTQRQEKANAEKGRLEAELALGQDLLVKAENARVRADLDKVTKEIYFHDNITFYNNILSGSIFHSSIFVLILVTLGRGLDCGAFLINIFDFL